MGIFGVWRSALFNGDVATFRAIHIGWHGPFGDAIFSLLSWIGLGHIQALACFCFLLSRRNRGLAWPLVVTIIVSGVAVAQVAKQLIERERPSHLQFAVPQEAWLYDSFPSGHTATSFGVAIMLWMLTFNRTGQRWWGPVATLVALAIGISRIYRGVHWPTDVLGGALGGVFSAALVYLIYDRLGKIEHVDLASDEIQETSGESVAKYV